MPLSTGTPEEGATTGRQASLDGWIRTLPATSASRSADATAAVLDVHAIPAPATPRDLQPPAQRSRPRPAQGPSAIVLEGMARTDHITDRLDDELDIVARFPVPPDVVGLKATLANLRPRLLLVKSSLDAVDYWLLTLCQAHRVQVLVLARAAYGLLGSTSVHRFGGLPWLRLRLPGRDRLGALLKRCVDVLLVLLSAPFLLPLMLVIAAILCHDGPPFYIQQRVGEGGRAFRLVKFRTMRVDAEAHTGPVLAIADDPRTTRVGRILRRLRIDELPQLWNVLRGDMSLVGPRPERPEFIEHFRRLPHYDLRHLIRPGLTGIAQLTGGYGATVEEKLRCDLLYVSCRSLRLDLRLLALTIRDLLRGFPRG
ncbi:sugar transferase [Actinopolymorpha alba]|uniref:sugar transferase n=1 Tax=Actinopolymorpha alba TaxID=533267 RepID=UPI001ED988F8|nr:sugar transferase [Actinopolymorpha alba]